MDFTNKLIENYILQFKTDINSKINALELITSGSTDTERDKYRELVDYIYEYPKLVVSKNDVQGKKTDTTKKPAEPMDASQICIAKRSDGVQCIRKKKKNCDYCGTHAKKEQMKVRVSTDGEVSHAVQQLELHAEDIHGIIYYIDGNNNVYHTEDILEGKENPRIIAKAIRNTDNSFMIPELDA